MYEKEIKEKLDKALEKLEKRDPELVRALDKKIEEILANPYHYKPLRKPLQNQRRVHVGKYVLVFQINEVEKKVEFLRFRHHDEAYV
jgi:YafQ family addiction module toxin component